jgi:hypothetical protein
MTNAKHDTRPSGCTVLVVVREMRDRYFADFYGQGDLLMFKVDMANGSVKLKDFLEYRKGLARFYDDSARR